MKTKLILLFIACAIYRPGGSQILDSVVLCRADFDYHIDDKIMTFAPAAAIQFVDKSFGNVVQWSWSFTHTADSFSTEQNPMRIYNYYLYGGPVIQNDIGPMPPVYIPTACLKIQTAEGCVSSICKPVYFYHDSTTPPQPGCYVYFEAYRNDTVTAIPEDVAYSFKVTAPKSVVKWHWDFGDNTTSDEAFPVHIYPFNYASYRVCLNITTIDSCVNSYCSYIFVGHPDTTVQPECQASFSASNFNSDPKYWYFQDKSTGNPNIWFWDFGDGTYASEQSPIHVFRKDTIIDSLGYMHIVHSSGIFKVCLTTLSENNCKSNFCDYVNTNSNIDSSFVNPCGYLINLVSSNILGTLTCKAKASATLIDSVGNPVAASSYFWSNGATGESTDNLCSNIPYYVLITSENGCQTAGSFAIMDYTKPYSLYGYWTVYGSGSGYNFRYALPANTYTCSWIFSDGSVREGENVQYNFTSPDSSNSVLVVVKDSSGNEVYSQTIKLGPNGASNIRNNKSSELHVYPNPVTDELKISMNSGIYGRINLTVYDAVGRIIISDSRDLSAGSEARLNTSSLPSGFYILTISSGGKTVAKAKFAK